MNSLAKQGAMVAAVVVVSTLGVTAPASAADERHGLEDLQTRLCIAANNAGQVFSGVCEDAVNEIWTFQARGGAYKLYNAYTGRCLDSTAAGVVTANACNTGNFQLWRQVPAGSNGAPSLSQYVDVATGLCLDSHDNGTIYTRVAGCNAGGYQEWLYV